MTQNIEVKKRKPVVRKFNGRPPEYYSVQDLQNLFCMSRGKILSMIYDGKFKAEKVDSKWFVRGEDLRAYLGKK